MMLEMSNREIYSNFKIDYPNYHELTLETLLDLPNNIEFVGDEFYTMVDSRNSSSHVNVFAGYVSFQVRKTLSNIFLSMIQLGSIDLRYREEWDYLVLCERIPNGEDDYYLWDFGYTIYNNIIGCVIPVVVFYEDAKPYFEKFNTYEIIKPMNLSRLEYAILDKKPKSKYYRALEIVKYIINDIKVYDKKGIKVALMRNDFDKIWAEDCDLVLHELISIKKKK